MKWKRIDDDYGRGFRQFMQSVLETLPGNNHWRTVRHIRPRVSQAYDLLHALSLLEHYGQITIDESNPLITRYRKGGRELKPVSEEFQVFTGFNRSRKLADSEYGV